MYQFYYADQTGKRKAVYKKHLCDVFEVTAIRPTMWEEHCLECSAPACFQSCPHYLARNDGRCRRFMNGISVSRHPDGCCGQSARVQFRKWANLMTIIYPAMKSPEEAQELTDSNQQLGKRLFRIAHSPLPVPVKWQSIRTVEYLRRRSLRRLQGQPNEPDAFVFHGYSFEKEPFRLILEIYDSHTPVYKTALCLLPGENLTVIDGSELGDACRTAGYLVKIYPENDLEAELDLLWCDFVQGRRKEARKPANYVKCVVWDLDQTLWNGTLIETEDPSQLELSPGVGDLIRKLDERGILQSAASKNDREPACRQLERLGVADYLLYPQISWGAKSASIEQIARSLNIGIDSLALIDDSAFEREQVRSVWPQVRTYSPEELEQLLNRKEFAVPVTEESRKRRLMYRAEENRTREMIENKQDTLAFLRSCEMQLEIFEPRTEEEIRRCYELTVRTNQLNMSGKHYTREEFDRLLDQEDRKSFAFSCEDRFGSYGIVGFGQYQIDEEQLVMQEFAMSCRAAGKYVESALFRALLEQEGLAEGVFTVQKTDKNGLLRRTLEEIGFITVHDYPNMLQYSFNQKLRNSMIVATNRRRID